MTDRSKDCKCPCHTGGAKHVMACACYRGIPVLDCYYCEDKPIYGYSGRKCDSLQKWKVEDPSYDFAYHRGQRVPPLFWRGTDSWSFFISH